MHTVSELSIKASWGLPDRRAWRNYGGALGLLIGVATLQGVLLPVADAAAYVLLYPLIVVISWWFGAFLAQWQTRRGHHQTQRIGNRV